VLAVERNHATDRRAAPEIGRKHLSGERLSGRRISSASGGLEGVGGVRPDAITPLAGHRFFVAQQALTESSAASGFGREEKPSRFRLRSRTIVRDEHFGRVSAALRDRDPVLADG
jgi:hypothetical protein